MTEVSGIFLNHQANADQRRNLIYEGNILLYTPSPAILALCNYAQELIQNTFDDKSPLTAQERFDVEEFVRRISVLKSEFTNGQKTKLLIRNILTEYGYALEETIFDLPRLRVVTYNNYLTAGVGYAYPAHRDTWYASPFCQENWWFPVYDLTLENALSFYPSYWNQTVENTSESFDYAQWQQKDRKEAVNLIQKDTRNHPLPQQLISSDAELTLVGQKGSVILFSAAHLHATKPNTAQETRFSLDFRTINLTDLNTGRGAHNIDTSAKGSTVNDFFRASDLVPFAETITNSVLSI